MREVEEHKMMQKQTTTIRVHGVEKRPFIRNQSRRQRTTKTRCCLVKKKTNTVNCVKCKNQSKEMLGFLLINYLKL